MGVDEDATNFDQVLRSWVHGIWYVSILIHVRDGIWPTDVIGPFQFHWKVSVTMIIGLNSLDDG